MKPQTVDIRVTPHLRLVQIGAKDDTDLFALLKRNRKHLGERLFWVRSCTQLGDMQKFIADVTHTALTNGAPTCGILYDGKLVGIVSFHPIDHSIRTAMLGYWIDKDQQGKGIVTAATGALIRYGFDVLGLESIELVCDVDNDKSKAIAGKLGFTRESETKVAIWKHDRDAEMVIFVLQKPASSPVEQSPAA